MPLGPRSNECHAHPGSSRRTSTWVDAFGPRRAWFCVGRSSCGDLLLDLLLVLGFLLRFVDRLGRCEDDVVDQPVFLGSLGRQEVIALGVERHLLDLLMRVVRQDLVQLLARAQDLFGVDLYVGGLTLHPTPWLVGEEVGLRQRVTLAMRAAGKQNSGHRVGHADADRRDRRAGVMQRVLEFEAPPGPPRPAVWLQTAVPLPRFRTAAKGGAQP